MPKNHSDRAGCKGKNRVADNCRKSETCKLPHEQSGGQLEQPCWTVHQRFVHPQDEIGANAEFHNSGTEGTQSGARHPKHRHSQFAKDEDIVCANVHNKGSHGNV